MFRFIDEIGQALSALWRLEKKSGNASIKKAALQEDLGVEWLQKG
jgi:hypothetical protein